jgi:hypothetical protein
VENIQSPKTINGIKFKCVICNGHGEVDNGWFCSLIEECENCKGTGYVDWVRNIRPLLNTDLRKEK